MSVTNWRKDKDTLCSAKHLSFSRHVVTFDIHIVQLFRRPLTLLKLSITDSKESLEVLRLVALEVSCPPQFLDMYPKITRHSSHEDWTFNIKAYTTTIEKCLLTTGSSGKMSSKEVNCTLHGDPPHLVLTVRLEKEGQAERKHWTLTLRHEKGYSSKISGSDTVDRHFRIKGQESGLLHRADLYEYGNPRMKTKDSRGNGRQWRQKT
ncbi:hypothetical protein C0Q70_12554 [Pomacea canaliculata]|uniref:Uncharacterized protein n=1 Tax=Pomacea canaliculata TaxID=400727 RepID=A0A2T7P1U9_POMCA|nr:hypothetical protein C0Q70_12554 [Pomacea canaliculata]